MNFTKPTIYAAGVAMLAMGPFAQARDSSAIEKRVAADVNGELVVSNVTGSVSVVGWDRPEVEVTGSIEEGVERVDVIRNGNRVTVKVVLPKSSSRDSDAELSIRAPLASSVEVSTVSADVEVNDMTGPLRLKTVSGEISAANIAANTEVTSVSGDVRLATTGKPISVRSSTVSGNLDANKVAGEVEAVSVSGDVIVDLAAARSARVRTTSGDSRISGEIARDATIDIETVSGDLTIKTSATGGFTAEAETFSGDLDNCFGVKSESASKYGPGERLSVKRGDGVARIRVRTMSGDVMLCDR